MILGFTSNSAPRQATVERRTSPEFQPDVNTYSLRNLQFLSCEKRSDEAIHLASPRPHSSGSR
jgi:hypothetical protein